MAATLPYYNFYSCTYSELKSWNINVGEVQGFCPQLQFITINAGQISNPCFSTKGYLTKAIMMV